MTIRNTLRAALLGALSFLNATKVALAVIAGRGEFELYHNGVLVETSRNIIPLAMRTYIVAAAYGAGAQITSWFIAPFSNAVTPADSLTAANFGATLAEFTNYTEANRPAWTPAAAANGAIENSVTLATITAGVGGGTINGIALLSVNTKGAATGTLGAATRFSSARALLEGDTLQFKYKMQLNAA